MSIAAAIRQMVTEGLSLEQAVRAAEIMEVALSTGNSTGIPPDSAIEKRRAWDRERKAKASASAKAAKVSTGIPPEIPNGAYIEPTLSFSTSEKKEELGGVGEREKSKRGSRLPSDWQPNLADIDFARSIGMTVETIHREASKFRDFWAAKAGAGGVKLDWSATWRNWIRNNAPSRQDRRNGKPSRIFDSLDRLETLVSGRADRSPDSIEQDDGTSAGGGMPGIAYGLFQPARGYR